ncbi:unnamed protein product [Echinostoma caproni]|uniref:G_PROTEIN_RECEP_F1_2 domain-containing protein n=1 Tax=Echinostoma caproni TaxID=27848 RepID=A0A183B6C8_9TREM|nr:unnamed protein product [Echinostoma caproni]
MLSVSILLLLLIAVDRWLIVCFVPSVRIPRPTLFFFVTLCYIFGLGWAIPMGLRHGVPSRFELSAVDQLIRLTPSGNQNLSEPVPTTVIDGANRTRIDHVPPRYVASLHEDGSLLKALMNFGTCQVDDRFIFRASYRDYQMAVLIFFTVVFTLICFIYGSIFSFVWWHQRRWRSKFTGRQKQDTREVTRSNLRLSSIQEYESGTCHTFQTTPRCPDNDQLNNSFSLKPNVCTCRERNIPLQELLQIPYPNSQRPSRCASHKDQCETLSPENGKSIDPDSEINQPKEGQFIASRELGPQALHENLSSTHMANKTSTHKACWTERKHKLRDSVRNRQNKNRQMKFANRHLRTAIMFILITVTFLVSYLPSLLISNGLIWQVEWETLNGMETGLLTISGQAAYPRIIPSCFMQIYKEWLPNLCFIRNPIDRTVREI